MSRTGSTVASAKRFRASRRPNGSDRWNRELYEIAPCLRFSSEERDRIEKAGQGEASDDDRPAHLGEPVRPHLARLVSQWPTRMSLRVLTSTKGQNSSHGFGRKDMLPRLLRTPR